ncbi:MAG TPA: DUF305 domain-containing protein [Pyrinomonadaceae bacterium]|nr:DUF305 domain-containing protein [Pyrinomonadaceae bacterium]
MKIRTFLRPSALCVAVVAALFATSPRTVVCQQTDEPVIVQPGRPGESTKVLPSNTTAKLPPLAQKDVEFMQGMIMHHAQAVEMTALIESRTENKDVRLLGARISQSQSDEINFMKRWLRARGQSEEMPGMSKDDETPEMSEMPMKHHSHRMPGMLTDAQMQELREAKGNDFDRLFLRGMIQHHGGALVMVKDLFSTAGAGQDAEIFNFATDVDSGQRSEIRIMQNLLEKLP